MQAHCLVILYLNKFLIKFIFLIISSEVISTFPSFSHSHAAAKDPIILDVNKDFVFTIERDE